MIHYKCDFGNIESTNYFMEDYQMKSLDKYVLLKRRKDGTKEQIGEWIGADFVLTSNVEMSEKEILWLQTVRDITTKRIGNDINGTYF